MKTHLFGLSSYYLMWVVATVSGIAVGVRLARKQGFAGGRSFAALVLVALAILVGSKLLFFVEHAFFPHDDPLPPFEDNWLGLLRHGFRIPGGILLMAAAAPLICRALRLPTRRFVDAIIPCIGVAVFFVRIGCFLNGCCFGARTDSIFGLRFPADSHVFEYQLLTDQIAFPAQWSLPVHPLQLYFALLGAAMYWFGVLWQRTKRFDGEVWAKEYLLFFGGTFALELMRQSPLHLNLLLTATTVLVTALLAMRARQAIAASPLSA